MDSTNTPSFMDKLAAFGSDLSNLVSEAATGAANAWQSMPTSSQVMVAFVAVCVVTMLIRAKFKNRSLRRQFLALRDRLEDPVIQATRIATADEFERV